MRYKLTEEEKAIEEAADNLRPVSAERREQIETIIRKVRKNQAISLRISEFDLEMLKKKAESEGLPYQTLISSVLHKYVTDQLFDRNEVRKAITELAVNQAP